MEYHGLGRRILTTTKTPKALARRITQNLINKDRLTTAKNRTIGTFLPKVVSMLRTLAERIARGRSFRRNITVNGSRHSIYVSPDAQLKYLKPGGFDHDLIEVAERHAKPGQAVWDIGANVGVFSVAAQAMKCSVVAVEADIWLAKAS